jgi:hypothetical protein
MRSTVADEVQTPFEKTLRPTFSETAQWSPAAFTRRVRPGSPGGSNIHPCGTVRTLPSDERTVFDVGPGENVLLLLIRDYCYSDGTNLSKCRIVASLLLNLIFFDKQSRRDIVPCLRQQYLPKKTASYEQALKIEVTRLGVFRP